MPALLRLRVLALVPLVAFSAAALQPPAVLAQRAPRAHPAPADDSGDGGDGEAQDEETTTERAPTGGVGRRTGFELELHGTAAAHAGREVRLRGVAYEVLGLATLRPLPRARIIVRPSGADPQSDPLASTVADAAGRFGLVIPAGGSIDVEVSAGRASRRFSFDTEALAPHRLELLTDRVLYEPGETIHAWARLTDAASAAPLPGRPVDLAVGEGASRLGAARQPTSAAGVVALDVRIPAQAPDGPLPVTAELRDAWGTRATTVVRIGRRTVERLMAEARVDQPVVAPGGRVTGSVAVRTPSGSPVRGARVEIRLPGVAQPVLVETDVQGLARFAINAPAYLAEPIEPLTMDVRVAHRAHGTVRTATTVTMARVPYGIEAVAGAGGLVPEVASTVYLTLTDPRGAPPPAGTVVSVTGAGVQGGSWRGSTDAHGLVAVPMRVPRAAAAVHQGGRCGGAPATSFDVTVESAVPVAARLCARVATRAEVMPRVLTPVVTPGGRVDVAVERRPAVRGRPVAVELLHRGDGAGAPTVLASAVLAAGDARTTLALPPAYVGPVLVRARPVGLAGVAEGTGASDAVLVRPAHAFALNVSPERPRYEVREAARLVVRSPQGLEGGHVALVVRDLAAHGGEQPFALAWLGGAVSASVADPGTPESERLVRAALAAFLDGDPAAVRAPPLLPRPGAGEDEEEEEYEEGGTYDEERASARGDLRDPFARRDELLRRGIGPVMMAIEQAVDAATGDEEVRGVVARGGRRGFDPAVVHTLLANGQIDGGAETLGGGEMTLAMLQAVEPAFTFDRVARRIARRRLVRLLAAVAGFVDPGEGGRSPVADEPPERWLSRMVQRGVIPAGALKDPWGGTFALRRVGPGREAVALAVQASGWELASPGPDRVFGTADDVRNPFERVVPEGTVYALVSGEDALMRALAALDPGHDVLARVEAAYQRIGRAAGEESEGDVVGAEQSEESEGDVLGAEQSEATVLAGGSRDGAEEGGPGVGYGAGAGGIGRGAAVAEADGRAEAPAPPPSPAEPGSAARLVRERADERQQVERGARQGPRVAQLAAVVRERFPATLHFVAQRALDPSGTTVLEVPLADALTTYRVEAIAWTAEGWTTSASTEVHVDQDAVVDAPVPPFALPGDAIRLPLRVSNRSERVIRARVDVRAEGDLALDVAPGDEVAVEPGDARDVVVTVTPRRPGRGTLVVTAVDAASGRPLDAARRPMEVLPDARPVRAEAEALVDGHAQLVLDVPRDAVFRAEGGVRVTAGGAVFGHPREWARTSTDGSWPAWAIAMGGERPPRDLVERLVNACGLHTTSLAAGYDPVLVARVVGALWRAEEVTDAQLAQGLLALTRALEGYERLSHGRRAVASQYARRHADVLLGLVPAHEARDARRALGSQLHAVVARLRRSVETDTAMLGDDAATFARAAAVLAMTEPSPGPRTREFMRRAARAVTVASDEVLVPGDHGSTRAAEAGASAGPAALYGLASLGMGDRAAAFDVTRTLARRARTADRWPEESRALASALAARLTGPASEAARGTARVAIDGRAVDVPLVHGVAVIPSRELSTAGRHTVDVALPAGTILVARAESRYGRPWSAPPPVRGALALTLDGAPGVRDARAQLVLRVQNRSPRVIPAPLVEIDLPAGAEVDQDTRNDLARRAAQPPVVAGRTLALRLRALAPGGFARIPLPLRWSVGGRLRGLGAAAYASDEIGAGATVLAPRTLEISDGAEEPGASPGPQSPAAPRSAAPQVTR
jgi:hypothetical protein